MSLLRISALVFVFGIALGELVAVARGAGSPAAAAARVASQLPALSGSIVVHPMTTVHTETGAGYFADPFPIDPFTADSAGVSQTFTGTTNESITCSGPVVDACFQATPLHLDSESLQRQLDASETKILTYVAKSVYRDRGGAWHMVASAAVNHVVVRGRFWYVLIHLHPTDSAPASTLPAQWSADTVLVGSLSHPMPANYAGKYFEDADQLYLVYVKRIATTLPDNGIVAQRMLSPVRPAPADPVNLRMW